MDRLLRILLSQFVRHGNFQLTTARGTVLTFGDGTGKPVAIRFTTTAAEIAILLDPELKFGECYMDGTLVVEQGSIADVLALVLHQTPDGNAAPMGAAAMAVALSPPPLAAVQSADARAAQRRASL